MLNLFTFRIAPSGFHAASGSEDPFFIRLHALLTPFMSDQDGGTVDAELRILGHAIRVLASTPIVPGLLPGASADPADFRSGPHLDYQLRAILQPTTMEEMNHIWTTQGGELAYRLSAAYEFALIPVELLVHHEPAGPVTSSILDIAPEVPEDRAGFAPFGVEAHAFPLAATDQPKKTPPPTDTLPVVLFATEDGLSNSASVTPATGAIDVALSGLPGARIALRVDWTRADTSTESQPEQVFTIASPRIDDPAATVTLSLDAPALGDSALIVTRATDAGGTVLPGSPFANTLTLATEAS